MCVETKDCPICEVPSFDRLYLSGHSPSLARICSKEPGKRRYSGRQSEVGLQMIMTLPKAFHQTKHYDVMQAIYSMLFSCILMLFRVVKIVSPINDNHIVIQFLKNL